MLLTDTQVICFRKLNKLLRKLKIIGTLEFKVLTKSITEFGKPVRYCIVITNYDPNSYVSLEDKVEIAEAQLTALMRHGYPL